MAFTFFFRDRDCLELALKHLIPAVMGRSNVRIWDAGCAMGHEPYTLAILLAERMGGFAFRNVHIYATDYDAPLLKVVEAGVYPHEEVQRIPEEYLERYFEPVDGTGNGNGAGHYRVIERIRQVISTHHHDLQKFVPVRSHFSLVVCKNVLLHFSYAERVEVIRMFHEALEPGGILVTEHTQKMPSELSGHFTQIVADGQVFRKVEVAS
jgi:chemotaxis protein methyltransferase CheR